MKISNLIISLNTVNKHSSNLKKEWINTTFIFLFYFQLKPSSRIKYLQEEIKLTKQRIKYLNHIIKDKSETAKKSKQDADKLRFENRKRTLRLPEFGSKVNKIDQCTKQHMSNLEQQRHKVNQR